MSENLFENLVDEPGEDLEIDPEALLQQLLDDPSLIQHLIRTEQDGCQTIVGYFRVVLEPGQQRCVVHVPFSPPLSAVPQVEAHVLDDQDARVRVTDCQKYGLRVEVILPRPVDSERRVLLEIVATESI